MEVSVRWGVGKGGGEYKVYLNTFFYAHDKVYKDHIFCQTTNGSGESLYTLIYLV